MPLAATMNGFVPPARCVRRALVDVDCMLLVDLLPVLRDHGLVVLGSARSPQTCVRLVIGVEFGPDLLPAECDDGWRLVRPQLVVEHYGRQRLTKIATIEVVGKPDMEPAAC